MKILIVYYSTYGNTYKMAKFVEQGVRLVENVEPVLRKVPELIPDSVINSKPEMRIGSELQKDVPIVTLDDFREASGYVFGTPTRFGCVSSQLKNIIDQLGQLWFEKIFEGKPAGIFVSTSTLHGGQEATILSLVSVLLHLGCVIVGVPYSIGDLFITRGGGSPYGPGHYAGVDNMRDIDENEANICRSFGKRIAELAIKLNR
ncbi:MAG: NAD(P)H:quinone oxidoreductase [Candidatus Omnitrophica bacterium]|nr:NAD(P)H:quinone oxidoreductase [Candidatus Omnitrophota bacterium]MCM8809295.1 NAD(P)H:quinone oxidoreductase [Candidatus Omnitrophota bacterium]MCM8810786.1 NAD(P)H:quinone oxidoreductase [Candidatus Omnitrophota bacterium]